MQTLADLLNTIPAIDPAAMSRAQRHIDGLLKPVGSLGRLEALAIQLAGMLGLNGVPHVGKKAVLVMCADHGVWEEGVAISPKEVTAIQAENMTRGTTGVCVLAAQAGLTSRQPFRPNQIHPLLPGHQRHPADLVDST